MNSAPAPIAPGLNCFFTFHPDPGCPSGYLLRKHFQKACAEAFLEVDLHRTASQVCPGVAQFSSQTLTSGQLSVDVEWCPDGDLQTMLEARVRESAREQLYLPADWLYSVTQQMLETLATLHASRIAHRQISLKHWVLAGNRVKLIDFSKAKLIQKDKTVGAHTLCNTKANTSPDTVQSARCRESTENNPFKEDVWALGKVLYELATFKSYRYLNCKPMDILHQEVEIQFSRLGYSPLQPVLLAMLAWDYIQRVTATEALVLLRRQLASPLEQPSNQQEEAKDFDFGT